MFTRAGVSCVVPSSTNAKAKGVKFGRKPTLTPHQQQAARERLAAGETQRSAARSYNVSRATISRHVKLRLRRWPPRGKQIRIGKNEAPRREGRYAVMLIRHNVPTPHCLR